MGLLGVCRWMGFLAFLGCTWMCDMLFFVFFWERNIQVFWVCIGAWDAWVFFIYQNLAYMSFPSFPGIRNL